MAGLLAIAAAFLFALAATLQQKGALDSGVSPDSLASLLRLVAVRAWLIGSLALLLGYLLQAIALDHGRLAIIQPLLVSTVVFALPLGYFISGQAVGHREIAGAAIVVLGLALFAVFGDPAGGKDNAPNSEWAVALAIVIGVCCLLYVAGRRATGSRQAGLLGVMSGILFGASACLVKPTVETLHVSVGDVLSSWQFYAMAAAGIIAFVVQQMSLSSGFLAISVATVSVSNPIVSIAIGTLLFDERLSRPAWHVAVAIVGLMLGLVGAILIAATREDDQLHGAEALAAA